MNVQFSVVAVYCLTGSSANVVKEALVSASVGTALVCVDLKHTAKRINKHQQLLVPLTSPCYTCAGADAASLSDMAEGNLGGEGPPPGPEHLTASDRGLCHPDLHPGAHRRSRLQLWY